MASSGSGRSGGGGSSSNGGGGGGGTCISGGAALTSINEGDEHVSLMDVLCSRDAWLSEEELWAVCRECCLAVLTLSASSETFQTYCVTPDTLAFDLSGAVSLLDFEVDDLLCKPPEFYSVGNTYKGHVYSLGTTMLMAAHYNMEGRKPRHSRRLTQLLAAMTDQDYDRRADLEFVLSECDTHMRGRASRDLCQRLAAIVTGWRQKGETWSRDATVTCRAPESSQITLGSERNSAADAAKSDTAPLNANARSSTAAEDQSALADGGARSPGSSASDGVASATRYDGSHDVEKPEAHLLAACELLRPPVADRRPPAVSNHNVSKSTGDLSTRLAEATNLQDIFPRTSILTLPVPTEDLVPHSRRLSAFTPRRELAAASAFTPFYPQSKCDISVRVYEEGATNDVKAAGVELPPPPRFRSAPVAYNSSATHFTPILLKSERKLFERSGEVKDKEETKKIKELKKNLLRNLQHPAAPDAAAGPRPSTRRSAALTDSVAFSAASDPDLPGRARKASEHAPTNGGAGSTTNTRSLGPAVEATGRSMCSEANPPPKLLLTASACLGGAAAPDQEFALSSHRSRSDLPVSLDRPIPVKRSFVSATVSEDNKSKASICSEKLTPMDSDTVAVHETGDHLTNQDMRHTVAVLNSINSDATTAADDKLITVNMRGQTNTTVSQKVGANSEKASAEKEGITKRPRKRRSNVNGHAEQQRANSTHGNAELHNSHSARIGDDAPASFASQPRSAATAAAVVTVEADCCAAPLNRGAAMATPSAARSDVRAPSPPPSPSLSKDSGVGGLGYAGGGDPVLMDKLFTSEDGLRTRAILGRILCLLRDEFSYDGFMENGVEDLAMAEYVSSLGGLSWSTFVSAVSEKYCDLYWQEELLSRMYEAVNGKAPSITRRPPTVVPTAHVIRVDEPRSPSARNSEMTVGTATASLPPFQSPFRPISSALRVCEADVVQSSKTDNDTTTRIGQGSAHLHIIPAGVSCHSVHTGADPSRSHSSIGKPPSRQPSQLSRKRSASVQELLNPSETTSRQTLGNGSLSRSSERLALSGRIEGSAHFYDSGRRTLTTPIRVPGGSRCGSACSNGTASGTTVIRVHGQLSDAGEEPRADTNQTNGGQRVLVEDTLAGLNLSCARTPSASSASSGQSYVSRIQALQRQTSATEVSRPLNEMSAGNSEQQIVSRHCPSSLGLGDRSQSRYSFGASKENEDLKIKSEGGLIDVIYYASSLQHMNSDSVLASSKLAESTDRQDLLKQLGCAEQQIALQTKQRNKALKYCRQLQALTCGEGGRGHGERQQKAFDSRAVFEKATYDAAEASDKLRLFTNTKRHIEMLLAERCGVELGVACSLAAANRNSPMALPLSSTTPDNSLLLFHEARNPRQHKDRTINSLHAASAYGLCCLLYARNSIVDQYIHHFFICYRYFFSPNQLLEFISDKYSASLMPVTRAAEINDNILPANATLDMEIPQKIQTRSLDLLQAWVEGYFSIDFKYNGQLCSALATFYESQVARHHSSRAEAGLRLLRDCERGVCSDLPAFSEVTKDDAAFIYAAAESGVADSRKMLRKVTVDLGKSGKDSLQYVVTSDGMLSLTSSRTSSVTSDGEPHLSSTRSMDNFSLNDYSMQEVSEQLTLMEQTFYDRCHPVFFMNTRAQGIAASATNFAFLSSKDDGTYFETGQQPETAGNTTSLFVSSYTQDAIIQYMIDRTKRMTHWVAAELVSCSSAKSQLALLKKFMGIARVCKDIGNYATCVAIIDGLENVIVRQLPAWKDIPYKQMEQLSSVKLFLKSDPMCLAAPPMAAATAAAGQQADSGFNGTTAITAPIIPSIPTFVTHVQQAELGSFTLANGMLKWNKLRMLARIVDQLRVFKQKRYLFEPDKPLCERLEARIRHMCLHDLDVLAAGHEVNFQRPRPVSKWMLRRGKRQQQQSQQQLRGGT